MSSATFNYFFRADLTLATYLNGVRSTITVSVVNKPLKDSSIVGTFWPILESVGDISYQAGEFLPSLSAGSIQLNNTIGSFGANRKFSDLLQRYTITDQRAVIFIGASENDVDTVSSWQQIADLRMSDWAHAANGASLTINTSAYKIEEKTVTLEVARTVSGMENAPESSLGRAVPLVLGQPNSFITPIRITADGATNANYALRTGFHGNLDFAGVGSFVTLDWDDNWQAVEFDPLTTNVDYTTAPVGGQYTLNTHAARAFQVSASIPEIVTSVQLRGRGNGAPGRLSDARLTVTLLRVDPVNFTVLEEMAVGKVSLSNYDAANNALSTDIPITISFDKPAFISSLGGTYTFYLAWAVTNFAPNELSLNFHNTVSVNELRKNTGDANNSYTEWSFAGTGRVPLYKLNKVSGVITTQPASPTPEGFIYERLALTQVGPVSGQANPPLDSIQILASVQGVRVAGSGAGAPVAVQTNINRLAYSWNGSAWVDSNYWDTTTFLARYLSLYGADIGSPTDPVRGRTLRAVYDSKTSFTELLVDVCKGTASRVGILPSGRLFMYPWGDRQAVVAEIPYFDITPLDWQQRDSSTVINRATIVSGRSPLYSIDTGNEKIPVGYERSTTFSFATSAFYADMTRESRVMYGEKELGDGVLNAYGVDSVVAEYYLTRFAKPAVYASFVVPWHRYNTLRMFDVINFQHPEFPAFYGTDPEPALPSVDTGSAVQRTDPALGYEFTRAETYRGLIEGISYVMNMEHAPAIKLTVLVLLNQPWDPT